MSMEVHIDWQGETLLVGRLHAAERGASVSFEYDAGWLQRDDTFAIDPTSLPLQRGAHHGTTLFGAIHDCGPDRWGRVLIERAVRKKVLTQKPYHEIDYVLALDDASRIGALRFRLDAASPFLAATSGKLPPLVRLNALFAPPTQFTARRKPPRIYASCSARVRHSAVPGLNQPSPWPMTGSPSQSFQNPTTHATSRRAKSLPLRWRNKLVFKSRNIGSCRWAAKVSPSSPDLIAREKPVSRSSLRPAYWVCPKASLVPTPCWLMASVNSATMSAGDLRELWRRLVFSLLASNYDDHLRNHGFLMHEPGRWSLSPAYDLNPVPEMDRARVSKTAITESQEEPTITGALAAATRFGLKAAESKKILREVFTAVSGWRKTGRQLRIKAATLDAYASAFEHPLMDEAGCLVGK